jgi:hypothetical protein
MGDHSGKEKEEEGQGEADVRVSPPPGELTAGGVLAAVEAKKLSESFHYIFHEDIDGLSRDTCPRFFKLPELHQQFVLHLCVGRRPGVISAAYRAAYEKDDREQVPQAYQLLRSSKVRAAVKEVMGVCGVSPEWVKFQLLRDAAGADIADFEPYLDGLTSLRKLRAKGVNTRAVKKARRTVEKDGSKHYLIELSDRMPALHELVRITGLATDQIDVKMSGGLDYSGMSEEELRKLEHATAARLALRKHLENGEGGNDRRLGIADAVIPSGGVGVDVLTGTTEPKW